MITNKGDIMSGVYRKKTGDSSTSRYVGGNTNYTTRLTSHERPASGNTGGGAKKPFLPFAAFIVIGIAGVSIISIAVIAFIMISKNR